MRLVELALAALAVSGCGSRAQVAPVSTTTPLSATVPGEPRVIRVVRPSAEVLALLDATDRTVADRALDGPRHAADLLTYLEVHDGMNVVQLAAGAGYLTDLLARSVGARGRLFAENPPRLLAASGQSRAWDERLERPIEARVVRLDAELDGALPAHPLDLVYLGDDLGDLGSDQGKVAAVATRAWYQLRSGGRFALVERDGDTAARAAIEGCGFREISEGRFWDDGTVALTFVKP